MMFHEIEPKTFHVEYYNYKPEAEDVFIGFCHNQVLLSVEANQCKLPTIAEAYAHLDGTYKKLMVYLFSIDDTRFFTTTDICTDTWSDYQFHSVRSLRHLKPMEVAYAATVGYQLWNWYMTHRFCGCCGILNEHHETERALCCPNCNNISYPQISPSVIVGVRNENKLLLTKYQPAHSSYQDYALLAGYIEAGESVEQTICREVMEEVGLKVKNIQYYKSQPWPFSGALLLGYFCDVDGSDEFVIEENELREAVWMERENVPDRVEDISLTSEMMRVFKQNKDYSF